LPAHVLWFKIAQCIHRYYPLDRSKYLQLAERTIVARGIPLTGEEIIDFASKYGLLPFEKYGTVKKTLQARIAEDISRNRNQSRFIRTGIGTYFLRHLANQQTIYGRIRWSPERIARQKPEHPHRILCVPKTSIGSIGPRASWDSIRPILANGVYQYQSEIEDSLIPVIGCVALTWGEKVFSYRIGVHTHFTETQGKSTVLLRKYLDEFDLDLFETDGIGATSCVARAVLPVLSSGRRSRLESGRLRPLEKVQFYQVSGLLKGKLAYLSSSRERLMLGSVIDLSGAYSNLPDTHRRLELNDPKWIGQLYADQFITDPDCKLILRNGSVG